MKLDFLFSKKSLLNFALIFTLFAQIIFWKNTNHIKPDMIIVPIAPHPNTARILSLGDEQFYFRQLAFKIQNAGDSWGRFTALKDYNYEELANWFYILDLFDSRSNFVPSIASYYFSQTQNAADTIHVINYLHKHAMKDLRNKWWWLSQAVYIANHRLKDKELALKLAYDLTKTPKDVDMPFWARQMPAFIHEQLGEKEQAKQIIVDILENFDDFSRGEINFMEYFLSDRLKDKKFRYEIFNELRKRNLEKTK